MDKKAFEKSLDQVINVPYEEPGPEEIGPEETIESMTSAQPDTTLLAQKIWTKVCMITDPEDANLQHEVIHYGDLKKVFLEVLGWEI